MAIFTAVAGAIAGVLFGGSVLATTLIAGALAFGTQLLVSYLTRPKARTYSANQDEIQIGGRVPAQVLYGKGATKGHHVYYAKYGSGNKYNADVFVLSNGWCDGLVNRIFFYGEMHNLIAMPTIGNETERWRVGRFGEKLILRFYDGRPGQLADAKLVADTANLESTWKTTSRLAGMAYVIVEREWDETLFEKGHPDFKFILRGLRLYDPRKDSTVAGGSGSHRLNNSATWEWTENPAVHRLNYQLGLRGLISNRTLIGEGKSLGQLDLNSYFAAMNVSDTLRAGKPTYQASLFVNGDDDHTEVLKEFDDAMAGYGMNRRGLSGVIVGAPQVASATLTDADIDAGRSKQIQHRKSAFNLYNHLSGQFISPEAHWEPESLKPIMVNAHVAADGRVRQTSNDFLQVTDPDIAQYLLQIRYRQQRKGGSATVPVSRRFGLRVLEGEWISYAGKTWLITGWQMDEELRITLTLAETGADVYSSAGIEPGPIFIEPPTPVNPSLLSTVQNFAIEVGTVGNGADQSIPALVFSWTPPEDPTIRAVRFQYFVGIDPTGKPIYEDQTADAEAGQHLTTKNVAPGAQYTARATIVTRPARLTIWTQWVTSQDLTGFFDVYANVDLAEIQEAVEQATTWLREPLAFSVAQHRETVEQLFTDVRNTIDADFEKYAEVEYQSRELRATYDRVTSEYREEIAVVSDDLFGVAARTETLEVALDGYLGANAVANAFSSQLAMIEANESAITITASNVSQVQAALTGYLGSNAVSAAFSQQLAQINANADGITALAGTVVGVEASVNEVSASGAFKAEVSVSPGGGWSNVGMFARTGAGATGAFGQASIFLQARTSGTPTSRAALVADQIVFTDGSGFYRPVIIQGGQLITDDLRVNSAHIAGLLTANQIDVTNLTGSTAFLNTLTVGTLQLAIGAATQSANSNISYSGPPGSGVLISSLTAVQYTYTTFQQVSGTWSGSHTSGQGTVTVFLELLKNGTQRDDLLTPLVFSMGPGGNFSHPLNLFILDNAASHNDLYRLRVRMTLTAGAGGTTSVSGNHRAIWFKR